MYKGRCLHKGNQFEKQEKYFTLSIHVCVVPYVGNFCQETVFEVKFSNIHLVKCLGVHGVYYKFEGAMKLSVSGRPRYWTRPPVEPSPVDSIGTVVSSLQGSVKCL